MKTTKNRLFLIILAMLVLVMMPLSGSKAFAAGGSLTQDGDGVYLIEDKDDLIAFSDKVYAGETTIDGKLMADIILNENVINSDGELIANPDDLGDWRPIGFEGYNGTFDGNGKMVKGIYTLNTRPYPGLFAFIGVNGVVKNLGVVDGYIAFKNVQHRISGGVCGKNYGTIENCYNTCTIAMIKQDPLPSPSYYNDNQFGGICGENKGTIKNCYNTGKIWNTGKANDVGGICGRNDCGTITNCYNKGAVDSKESDKDNRVGGVCGFNWGGDIQYSYNTGAIESRVALENLEAGSYTGLGGVVGYQQGNTTYPAIIKNCYNTGSVTGYNVSEALKDRVGGICGDVKEESTATIENSYYLKTCCDNKDTYGIPKNNVDMKDSTFVSVLNGETTGPFKSDTSLKNNGYPVLDSIVEVVPVTVTGVTLNKATLSLTAGGATGTLIATVGPADATNKSVTWSSSDESVATVANGLVTPAAEGTATIRVTTVDGGKTATCEVTVAPAPIAVTEVTLNKATLSLTAGGATGILATTVNPADATNKSVTWSSSDESVATVANGVVTPVAVGTATITVTTVDGGFSAICEITVVKRSGSGGGGGGVTTTTYTITTNAGIGGSIDSDTTVSVKAGENIKFNIKPNQGYAVEDVKVDGKSVGAVSDYEFTKVNENHTISATFKKIEDTKPEIDKSYNFTDVSESEWYYESVMMACDKDWFSGTSDATFSPDTAMNRGMLATVLWRIEGEQTAKAHSFHDVATDKYYNAAVAWAAEHGIVSGYGNDLFGPDDSITREQMAVMLYNYAKYKGYDLSASGDLSKFVDGNKTTDYAVNAIKWAVGSGIINGKGGSILDPTGNSTRAEVATMLMKFLQR